MDQDVGDPEIGGGEAANGQVDCKRYIRDPASGDVNGFPGWPQRMDVGIACDDAGVIQNERRRKAVGIGEYTRGNQYQGEPADDFIHECFLDQESFR